MGTGDGKTDYAVASDYALLGNAVAVALPLSPPPTQQLVAAGGSCCRCCTTTLTTTTPAALGNHTAAYGTAAKGMSEDFLLIDDYFEDFGGTTWDGCFNILKSWKAVLSNTDLVVHNFYFFWPPLQL